MQILSLDLKNFKIHQERHFDFQAGTNAISGENGAGKTSLLEAIAWVLFDYNSGYTLADLIRNGSKNAEAKVSLISSQDGDVYQVCRSASKSGSSYKIFKIEPQLENLGLEKKEDVLPWLRQHLGVPPETELADLFKNTIGIPQGTFTLDFLKTPEERKKVFDPILKVEDYRQAHSLSSKLETYAGAQVKELDQEIARYQDSLADWETWQKQHRQLAAEMARHDAELAQLLLQIQELTAQMETMAAQAEQIRQFQQQLELLQTQIDEKHVRLQERQAAVAQAKTAAALCDRYRTDYEAFLQIDRTLQNLYRDRQAQTKLEQERTGCEASLGRMNVALAKLDARLEVFKAVRSEIAQLDPQIEQQEALEQRLQVLGQQLQVLLTVEAQLSRLQVERTDRQRELQTLQKEMGRICQLEPWVSRIPALEGQIQRYQEQLGRLGAAQQFAAEIQHLVTIGRKKGQTYTEQVQAIERVLQEIQQAVPLFSGEVASALTVFQAGVDLTEDILTQLEQILADLSSQMDEPMLQKQLRSLQGELTTAQKAELEFATLTEKNHRELQLQEVLQQLTAEVQQIEEQLSGRSPLITEQQQLAQQLQALNDPRGRKLWSEQQLREESTVQAEAAAHLKQQGALQAQLAHLQQQLAPMQALQVQIQDLEARRNQYQEGYRLTLHNQKEAESLSQRQQDLDTTQAEITNLDQQRQQQKQAHEALSRAYDLQQWETLQAALEERKKQKYQLEGGLPGKRQDLARLEEGLRRCQQWAQARDQAQAIWVQKDQLQRFIKTAREVFDGAGPRVTRLFTQKISGEADRIFRELMHRPGVNLEWTEDYEIRLQEAGNWRSFKSLSGGEQMCAALAVRLALIRILADIDIVFLDEPTTNMDETRRKQLAQAVANVTSFRQLFVISHDDTFENAADSVIFVDREEEA
ncbi:hypothetical protein BST81_26060 [Leptolyngbya sp. 'hensonii']|uniref:AAA family ATPase n=1 Tax=Leptolyngbya sp. 'hensonii' TaxID=1922337 RepID=UPI00094F90E6|nr:SMC family ATPase [Leptolyngbya sp. 'hensonii']OLP15487.1 hypothetical protein BST81_26060 [Leptolyngbya sp. 'hensonii']